MTQPSTGAREIAAEHESAAPVVDRNNASERGSWPLKVYALTCGSFQAPINFFIEGGGTSFLHVPVTAYLIDHPKGRALFDTGLGLRFRRQMDEVLGPLEVGFAVDDSADIAARLRQIEVDPGSIRWIINSHLHPDHAGGNAFIPNATILVQTLELTYAREQKDDRLYHTDDMDTGHPVRLIDGEHDLYGDGSVILFPTPGHTPGHQSARIKLPDGDAILAADCCYLKQSLDTMTVSSLSADREQSLRTLRRLAALRATGVRIFYGHDPEFWRTMPQGRPLR
jgi:N-acyl homoserine lactone hydrolase